MLPELPVIAPEPMVSFLTPAKPSDQEATLAASQTPVIDESPPEDPITARGDPLGDPPAVGGVEEAQTARTSGGTEENPSSNQEAGAPQQEAAVSGSHWPMRCT